MERSSEPLHISGYRVFLALIGLTLIEYWIAALAEGPIPYPVLCGLLAPITWIAILVNDNPLPFLGLIAVFKAALVLRYFMHITHLWQLGPTAVQRHPLEKGTNP